MAGRVYTDRDIGRLEKSAAGTCVFVSYKTEDRSVAMKLVELLRRRNVSVWTDYLDEDVGAAAQAGDSAEITNLIQERLRYCSHLLCLISSNSKGSWWIPYEVGAAQIQEKSCAFLMLRDAGSTPAWMSIGRRLFSWEQLDRWIFELPTPLGWLVKSEHIKRNMPQDLKPFIADYEGPTLLLKA